MKKILIILLFIPFAINAQPTTCLNAWWFNGGNSLATVGSYNGVDSATVSYSQGISGQCANYSTKGHSYLNLAAITNLLHGSSAITFSMWVKYTTIPYTYAFLFSSFIVTNGAANTIAIRAADSLWGFQGRSIYPETPGAVTYGTKTLTRNTWYFLTVVLNYTANTVTTYVNGETDFSGSYSFTSATYTKNATPPNTRDRIGAGNNAFYTQGSLDQVQIDQGAWTAADAKNKYAFYKGFYQ